MKHLFIFLLVFCTATAMAQNISIKGFTVKRELPGDVSQWPPDAVNAIAQSDAKQGGQESKMIITIEKGGSKICGNDPGSASLEGISTKAITANTIKGALGNCMLMPGTYTLCIVFLNADNVEVSKKQCRDFIVAETRNTDNPANPNNPLDPDTSPPKTGTPAAPSIINSPVGSQVPKKYRGPYLIMPANNTNISKEELKKPVKFTWGSVIPPPQPNNIKYTLRIYLVENGQEPEQAWRTNPPILEKDYINTMAIWQIPVEYTSSKERKTFIWGVQAIDKEGNAYGDNDGKTEVWKFMLGGGNDMHSIFDTLECTAKTNVYKLTVTYKNDKANDYNITAITPISSTPTTSLTITNIIPSLPSNVGISGATRTFTCDVTTGVAISALRFKTNYASVSDPVNDAGMFPDTSTVRTCSCNYCDDKKSKITNVSTNIINNVSGFDELEINADLFYGTSSGANVPVNRIVAEIVGFEHKINSALCTTCNNSNEMHGVFVNPANNVFSPAGSWLNTGKAILYPAANYSRQAEWNSSTGVNMATAPQHLKMRIGLPEQNNLQCCSDIIRVAIRFSFVSKDENGNCRICEMLKMACIVRKGTTCPSPAVCPDVPHLNGTASETIDTQIH